MVEPSSLLWLIVSDEKECFVALRPAVVGELFQLPFKLNSLGKKNFLEFFSPSPTFSTSVDWKMS